MPTTPTIIEGFVIDPAFLDQSKAINGILVDESGNVGTLTPKALSYFDQPAVYKDSRDPGDRVVNWTPTTNPSLVVDETKFSDFVTAINGLVSPVSTGFFKLLDKLFFDYNAGTSHEDLEAALVADEDIAAVYVADSFAMSATIVSDNVYASNGATTSVSVPTFVTFSIEIPHGSDTET